MSEGIVNNNPKKELLFALGGIAMFLGIVLLIGVSAFLRPAGEHITAETTEASAAADEAEATATEEEAAPADAETATTEEASDATAPDTAADATVTPEADADADSEFAEGTFIKLSIPLHKKNSAPFSQAAFQPIPTVNPSIFLEICLNLPLNLTRCISLFFLNP